MPGLSDIPAAGPRCNTVYFSLSKALNITESKMIRRWLLSKRKQAFNRGVKREHLIGCIAYTLSSTEM